MSVLKRHFQFSADFVSDSKGKHDVSIQWQPLQANFLVIGSPHEKRLLLYDRQNQEVKEILIPSTCSHLAWNRDGLLLAFVCLKDQATPLYMWSPYSQKITGQELDSWNSGKVTWIGWSPTADVLAVAFNSGNIIILDKASDRKVIVRDQHQGPIVDAAWSTDGILATCSSIKHVLDDESKSVTSLLIFTFMDGEQASPPRECPYGKAKRLRFAASKFAPIGQRPQNTLNYKKCNLSCKTVREQIKPTGTEKLSCLINNKTVLLYDLEDDSRSLHYTFKLDYGSIVDYFWFGDGYILICFQKGILIWVSSHPDEQGKELLHVNISQSNIVHMSASDDGARFGICTDNLVKVFQTDLGKMRHTEAALAKDVKLRKLSWTSDGSLVATIGSSGQGFVFLAKTPDIGCSWRDRVAFMVTLDTFHVTEIRNSSVVLGTITCDFEPNVVALGPCNFAAAINNLAVYYLVEQQGGAYSLLGRYEYSGIIQSIEMTNGYAVVLLTDGKVITHQLNQDPANFVTHVDGTLSSIAGLEEVSCVALADKNVYFGTSGGSLGYFSISGHRYELAIQHTSAITFIKVKEPDALIIFSDIADETFLYCLLKDTCLPVPNLAGKPLGVFFDWVTGPEQTEDLVTILVIQTPVGFQFYAYIPQSINGAFIDEIKPDSKFSDKSTILGMSGGSMALLTSGLMSVVNIHHDEEPEANDLAMLSEYNNTRADKLNKLHRYHEAAAFCRERGLKQALHLIGEHCIREMNVDLAIVCFRESGNYEKALLLEQYATIDHLPRLAGYMALVDGKPELAVEWFLKASDPLTVLEIYSDLMQWEKAIALAESHAQDKVSYACQHYAAQLELLADFPNALHHYQKALSALKQPEPLLKNQIIRGLARMAFRLGDMGMGRAIVQELNDRSLLEECAVILEDEKHLGEAAKMYKDSGNLERAATVFLRAKDWKAAEDIIDKIDSVPLKLQLGKSKETLKDYAGAIKLYEAAGDDDSVVRLLLEALNRVDLAIEVVDRTRSQEGAKMVAAHFMKIKDFSSAIRYLLISGRGEEAFLTAQQYNQMEVFSQVVGEDQPNTLYEKIATYYTNRREFVKSAQYLIKAAQSRRAVEMLLKLVHREPTETTEEDFLLNTLVNAAVSCKDSTITDKVVQVLLGSESGTPKDEKYLLDLYLFSGQHREADRIAVLVAEHHLDTGDYKEAHQVLYRTHIKLLKTAHGPSSQLFNLFSLVHSHAVSVVMHGLKEHEKVARMLIRICRNIGKFPKDASRFLLSAVLECTKCQLNKSAMEFALVLMQPQYRAIVTQKYESKILNILRKGGQVADADEEATDCPFGSHKLPNSQLFCPLCKLRVPFCVLTGMHMIRSDCAFCPGCDMPAIYSQVKTGLSAGLHACPMCSLSWSTTNMQPSNAVKIESFFRRVESSQLTDS